MLGDGDNQKPPGLYGIEDITQNPLILVDVLKHVKSAHHIEYSNICHLRGVKTEKLCGWNPFSCKVQPFFEIFSAEKFSLTVRPMNPLKDKTRPTADFQKTTNRLTVAIKSP